jgi:hypothetical protein
LTITNAYSHLINALDDYGAGFTFTNRWGIYQAGSSDKNYFAANMLLGSTTDNGLKLQVTGVGYFSSNVGIGVVPSTWGVTIRAIDIQTGGASVYGGNSLAGFTANSFIDNTTGTDTYKVSDYATKYLQILGTHRWYTAPSGTAGNSISFNQFMTLNLNGNLLIGSTTDTGNKLYLNGSLRIDGQQSATSGGNSGQHLIINLDGTTYKIKLENP